jgi:hypothetical protein
MLIRTASDLKTIFRREVDDLQEGINAANPDSENLWKDDEVYFYMYEAECEVARRTFALQGTKTLTVTADEALVSLPFFILDINHARLVTGQRELHEMNMNEVAPHEDDYGIKFSGNQALFDRTGTPTHFIRDYDKNGRKLRLWPTPVIADTLVINAYMLPNRPIIDGQEVLSFDDPRDIRLMLCWMKYLAYQKQDADGFDKGAAASFEAEFERKMAVRRSEVERVRRRPGTVRCNW